ncbi:hypothetical protein OG618_01340 [Kitasatospora sp. NBC_01246]|uniref:hypothetical protein n=1 Tax=Kitasatospora sp. NBC_01246 TaxID=2903570 RepID=UPI002E3705B8|nr:hypothetical protein [Kitasatospora sp. NBC_01246]
MEQGRIGTLLLPGPSAFSLNDREARAVLRRLHQLGCRVLEPPGGGAAFVPVTCS